jgi:uncharacterized protein with HEPN domain
VTEDKDERRLRAIRSDIERIQRTLKAHGDDAFLEDADVQDAIIMRLYRISDLTSRLSDALRGRHPEINWREIRGARNVMAHAYTNLELPTLMYVVEHDLPSLLAVVDAELDRQ